MIPGVDERGIASFLGRDQVPKEAPGIALKRTFHPKCVIDLIGVAVGEVSLYIRNIPDGVATKHGDRIISRFPISESLEIKSNGSDECRVRFDVRCIDERIAPIKQRQANAELRYTAVRSLLSSCARVARGCDILDAGVGPPRFAKRAV